MIRIFDFGMPTDPYFYGASNIRQNPNFDYIKEYIKHKKVCSIVFYKKTQKFKLKLQELTYNSTFADARQKDAFRFSQKLMDFGTMQASTLSESINRTIRDMTEAYKYQLSVLKENGIFVRTDLKVLSKKTLDYIESSAYICFKYDCQPDLQYAPFITEIHANKNFCELTKFKPMLSDGFNGLKIFTLMKIIDWSSTFRKYFIRRTLKKPKVMDNADRVDVADYFLFPGELHFIDTDSKEIKVQGKIQCYIERYFKDYRMIEKQY